MHTVPALFSDGYFSMKKGVLRSKIFQIHYKLSENPKMVFHGVFGDLDGAGTLHCAPPPHLTLIVQGFFLQIMNIDV